MRPGRLLFSAVLWLAALATLTFLVVPVAAIFQKVAARDPARAARHAGRAGRAEDLGRGERHRAPDRARRRHTRVVPHRDAPLSRPLRRDHAARAAAGAATGRRRHRAARRLRRRGPARRQPADAGIVLPFRERGGRDRVVRRLPVLPAPGDRGVRGASTRPDGRRAHARRVARREVRANRACRSRRRWSPAGCSPSPAASASSGRRSSSPATYRGDADAARSRSTAARVNLDVALAIGACSWCSARAILLSSKLLVHGGLSSSTSRFPSVAPFELSCRRRCETFALVGPSGAGECTVLRASPGS